MTSAEIRTKYLKFFDGKGHKIVPSSSLVPEGDASVLFTTAGMQQFKPYYIGAKNAEKDFGTLNTTSVQKCIRTSDIEEVGDERHLTFFEMLGNFSFGGYWKEEAIKYAYEFITSPNWMNLKIDYVTVFEGETGVPADEESEKIWKSIDPNIVVKKFGKADNFWGPTGDEGPCGPTTEIYVDGIEIWNIVFNEFYQDKNKTLRPLEKKGIDTGMGLERLALVSQFPKQTGEKTVFDTDLFDYIESVKTKEERIVADHMRTAVFMIADGVAPSNTERGYVLRRLIRRAIVNKGEIEKVASRVIEKYKDIYDLEDKEKILNILKDEKEKFQSILDTAEKYLGEFANKRIPGDKMFALFSSKGIPFELAESLGYEVDNAGFEEEFKKHQEISKAGMEQKFKGGLGGHSEIEVKYHTATHLLHQALREVLGKHVEQKGSNITPERLRFDFSHPNKMTDEEKKKVEEIVNQKIKEDLPVNRVVMKKEEAEKIGALHFFGDKYGDEVSIYYIGENLENAWSKEFCGGPHRERTGNLGNLKILKEEAISAGIRRIKAILD
ncbi:MAG: alanine--tRNA ligase [Patescibacteria group bacterium]